MCVVGLKERGQELHQSILNSRPLRASTESVTMCEKVYIAMDQMWANDTRRKTQ